ncbi:MADS-box transcription factor [Parasponia andersonii]|uniref:MADS-box transcription factor n=1 Tax=Parasponia andersonii TaxID=3476 RepID=A0A2P5ATV8_PARAD|nr:MADS-box transcription factor [Parasponia andersonii]
MEANNTDTTTTTTTNNNNNNKNIVKKTKGRQKTQMKMIEDGDDRLITFSKRRSGIYKKASELVTLCGAEVGIVIFSPSGKPFSYGHPSIESVANDILLSGTNAAGAASVDTATHPIFEAHRRLRISELNQQYNDLFGHLETEKERRKEVQKMTEEAAKEAPEGWWDSPVEGLSLDELKRRLRSLEELHANITNHLKERKTMSDLGNTNNNNKKNTNNNNNNNNNDNNDNNAPAAAALLGTSSLFNLGFGESCSSVKGSDPFVYPAERQGAAGFPHQVAAAYLPGFVYGHNQQ